MFRGVLELRETLSEEPCPGTLFPNLLNSVSGTPFGNPVANSVIIGV
jgi:hypothetical protein